MAILLPAIKGRLGETDYYEGTMKARDFVQAVRPPKELDDWANFSIEERMQRDPNMARIQSQIAPYLANNQDRFFGSIIVLMNGADTTFEPVAQYASKLPAAYQRSAEQMGFLTINGGTLVVLDGQHRYLALRMVLQVEVTGVAASTLSSDDVSVIFIEHRSDLSTRRIFNVVNRYAKPTGRADNIITSEDDGYAIVARALLSKDQPLSSAGPGGEELVDWRSNTLGVRSVKLTTLSAVYDSVKLILEDDPAFEKLSTSARPTDPQLEQYLEETACVWRSLLEGMDAYKLALKRPKDIPIYRADDHDYALLFKPASQIGLIDGLLRASRASKLTFAEIVKRANLISDWSMASRAWRGVIVKQSGAIDAGAEARRRMADVLTDRLAADHLSTAERFRIWRVYNESRGHRPTAWIQSAFEDDDGLEPLPTPIVGDQFTVEDARKHAEADAFPPLLD